MKKWILFAAIFTIVMVGIFAVIGSQMSNKTNNVNSEDIPENNAEFRWYTDLNLAISEAQKTDKQIFTVFTADWCPACVELDSKTFSNPEVQKEMTQKYIPVKIDVDKNPQLSSQYRIFSLPTMLKRILSEL
ncbi:MAG: thioredoxin family protein, partial [Euryarchaeota archaeon]|nr:thioredoxin family protein [Euryarchaeota archaeon]